MKNITKHTALFLILISISFSANAQNSVDTDKNSDQCTIQGLFYTVQLGVFSNPVDEDAFPESAKPVYHIKRDDGLYTYFAGVFDDRFDALLKRYEIVKRGYYEAYVTAYYKGKIVSLLDANDILAEHGESVIYNYEKSEEFTEKSK